MSTYPVPPPHNGIAATPGAGFVYAIPYGAPPLPQTAANRPSLPPHAIAAPQVQPHHHTAAPRLRHLYQPQARPRQSQPTYQHGPTRTSYQNPNTWGGRFSAPQGQQQRMIAPPRNQTHRQPPPPPPGLPPGAKGPLKAPQAPNPPPLPTSSSTPSTTTPRLTTAATKPSTTTNNPTPTGDPRQWDFLQGWLNSYDAEVPDVLLKKCQPLYCELCKVKMNSSVQSKMHYDGKVHDKHSRNFLVAWAKESGLASPPKKKQAANGTIRASAASKAAAHAEAKQRLQAEDLYCPVCDLNFTSQQHAEQHYGGRNHTRKAAGLAPLKTGYFNKGTGKWQRHPTEEQDVLNSGRDPGQSQAPAPPSTPVLTAQAPPLPPTPSQTNVTPAAQSFFGGSVDPSKKLFCELCKVGATSQAQLDMHLNGKNHRMRAQKSKSDGEGGGGETVKPGMKRAATQPPLPPPLPERAGPAGEVIVNASTLEPPAVKKPKHSTPEKKIKKSNNPNGVDYSAFRTPSGQYYCPCCNTSLNSESQFGQHKQSKKHKLKAAAVTSKKDPGAVDAVRRKLQKAT